MTSRYWPLLLTLASLWGASYLFIKVGLEDVEPVFLVWVRLALAYGALFLDEAITATALAGLALVLAGTALATGLVRARPSRSSSVRT